MISKEILWAITIVLWIIAYIPYRKDMIKWTTTPHIFSWIIRWVGAFIVFVAQYMDGAGPGAWSNLFAWIMCTAVCIYGYMHWWSKHINRIDRYFLLIALAALWCYFVTDGRLWSVILISIADIVSFAPTYRKARHYPESETVSMYVMNAIKFWLMVLATEVWTFVTIGNTFLWLGLNLSFVIFLSILRRRV